MNENKKQYQQVEFQVYSLTQNDVVRTSNGLEVDYSNDGSKWGTGYDSPIN